MRRQFTTTRQPELEGSPRSLELATAAAQVCDPDFLEAVVHLKATLDRWGGQVYLAPYRLKVDPSAYQHLVNAGIPSAQAAARAELEDYRQPGIYVTQGYLWHYDHIAKLTNAPREPDARTEEPLELPEQLTEATPTDADEAELMLEPEPAV